ncbi:MAG: carbohydrate binding domain-containing protein, partial [Kiritimatiellales bacterium]
MKYCSSFFIVSAVALNLSAASTNLLSNGSFEPGFSPWQLWYNELGIGSAGKIVKNNAAHGDRAVEVTASANSGLLLSSEPVSFVPGRTYTLSAFVRGTPGVRLTAEFVGIENVNRWFPAVRVSTGIALTDEWQRISVSGSLPETELNRCFVFFRPEKNQACTFAVDGVQLCEGDREIPVPGETAQFSFFFGESPDDVLNRKGGIYGLEEPVMIGGAVCNPGGGSVRCDLLDVDGQNLFSEQVALQPDEKQRAVFHTVITGQPLGWYRVILKLLDVNGNLVDEQWSSFVRISDRNGSDPETSPFGVCVLGNPDVELSRAAAIGVRHVRMHDCGFLWKDIFPHVNGEPKWKADCIVRKMADRGLVPFVYTGQGSLPPDRRSEQNPSVPKDLTLYQRYWTEITSHYRGQIPAFEVENEPYFRMNAEEYLGMLKTAYEGAKAGNPNGMVAGVCGDPFGDAGFIHNVLAEGGAQYMDALAIHVYVSPEAPEWRLSDVFENVRKEFDEAGGAGKPVWLTEAGYKSSERDDIPQRKPKSRSLFVSLKQGAAYLVRTHMMALGCGIDRLYWISMATPGPFVYPWSMNEPGTHYGPKPVVAAYAAMTKQLGALNFQRRAVDGSGCYAYCFSGDSGETAVIWSVQDAEGTLPVRADGPDVFDLYGNPVNVESRGNVQFIPLSEQAHYVTSAGPVVPLQAVEIRVPKAWDMTGSVLPLSVTVSGFLDEVIDGVWRWDLPPGWEDVSEASEIHVVPGESRTLEMRIQIPEKDREGVLKKIVSGRLMWRNGPALSASAMLEYIRQPVPIAHDLWLEAELPAQANFDVHPEPLEAAFGGAAVRLDTRTLPPGRDKFELVYHLTVEQEGEYEKSAASLPAGLPWSSPFQWKMDDSAFHQVV